MSGALRGAAPTEWRPTCMTPAEYRRWDDFATHLQVAQGIYKPSICRDCTAAYRKAAGDRCNRQRPGAAS